MEEGKQIEKASKYRKYYAENREKVLSSRREYRLKNKEKIAEKIHCSCGAIIRKDAKARHEKSKKHLGLKTTKEDQKKRQKHLRQIRETKKLMLLYKSEGQDEDVKRLEKRLEMLINSK